MGARRSFFGTGFGTLAILPNAGDRADANQAGTFLLPEANTKCVGKATRNPIWFQFNHHLSDSTGERRHLGALIIVLSKSTGSKRVEVYRNKGWTRPNSYEILGEFSKSPDLSWEEFAAISRESDLRKVDNAFGGPWHAIPVGSDKFSWSYREFWNWAVPAYESTLKSIAGEKSNVERFRVSARLIAYTPTPIPSSKKPVVFSVNASQGDTVFIALYSLFNSGQDIRSWYWIELR